MWPLRLIGVGVVLLLVGSLVLGQIGAQTSCGGGGGGDKPPPVQETGNISGKVVRTGSETGPARAANVRVEGTEIATSTGEDGSFRLVNVPVGRRTVVVSYREATISFTTEITRGENSLPLPIEVQIGEPPVEDKRPPVTTIIDFPREPMEVESLPVTVEIEFEGEDDVTPAHRLTFSWQLDNGSWSSWDTATRVTISVSTEGVHTFRVKARDEAGNEDISPAVVSFEVVIKEPPEDTRAWGLEFVRSIQFPKGRGEGELLGPYDVAVDSHSGDFWFADGPMRRISHYTSNAVYRGTIGVYDPRAVVLDGDGNVFTCSFTDGLVQKFGPSGSELARVAIAGARDIVLAKDERWGLVTRSQFLVKVAASLQILNAWGYPGVDFFSSGINPAQGLAYTVASDEKIRLINTDFGNQIDEWPLGTQGVVSVLKVSGKDLLIVCDSVGSVLKGYQPSLKQEIWALKIPGDGKPTSAAMMSDDNQVAVLEYATCKVHIYRLILMD